MTRYDLFFQSICCGPCCAPTFQVSVELGPLAHVREPPSVGGRGTDHGSLLPVSQPFSCAQVCVQRVRAFSQFVSDVGMGTCFSPLASRLRMPLFATLLAITSHIQ
jgi:hypothetical protein